MPKKAKLAYWLKAQGLELYAIDLLPALPREWCLPTYSGVGLSGSRLSPFAALAQNTVGEALRGKAASSLLLLSTKKVARFALPSHYVNGNEKTATHTDWLTLHVARLDLKLPRMPVLTRWPR